MFCQRTEEKGSDDGVKESGVDGGEDKEKRGEKGLWWKEHK